MYKIIIIFFLLSVLGLIHKHLLKGALLFLFIQFSFVFNKSKNFIPIIIGFFLFFISSNWNGASAQYSDIIINSAGPTAGGTWNGAAPWVFTPNAATAVILNTDIQTKLLSGNVTIAGNTNVGGSNAGNITVSNTITSNNANGNQYTLTFITGASSGSIAINAAIDLTGGVGVNNNPGGIGRPGANLTLTAGATGTVNIANAITTTGGRGGDGNANPSAGGVGGIGGTINISGPAGITVSATLTSSGGIGGNANYQASGGGGGKGGTISLTSITGTLSIGAILTASGGGAGTTGGGTAIVAGIGGDGGTIQLAGNVVNTSAAINAVGSVGGTANNGSGANGGAGGTIIIGTSGNPISGSVTIGSTLNTSGGTGSNAAVGGGSDNLGGVGGGAGSIGIVATGNIHINTASNITAVGGAGGTPGSGTATAGINGGAGNSVTINSIAGNLFVNTSTISSAGGNGSSAGGSTVTPGSGGNAGAMSLSGANGITITGNITATGGAKGTIGTGGSAGTGGDITFGDSAGTVTSGGGANDGITAGVVSGRNVIKNGTGILNYSSSTLATYTGTTTINAGTLQLGVSNKLPSTSNMILNSGTLSTGSVTGYSQTFGTITITDNSSIDLSSGGILNFSNSNGLWTGGKTLTVIGWQTTGGSPGTKGRIYVGTNTLGLNVAQLGVTNFTNFAPGAIILTSGEVVPVVSCTVTASPSAICNSGTATLSATGGPSYNWSSGCAGSVASCNVSPTITTTYTVTVINGFTCVASVVVTVNPIPTVTAGGGTICTGSSTSITAGGASTYSWSNGLGTGTPKTVSPTTSLTYTVTGTDVNSCTNTANAVVIVNPLPTVTTAVGGAICSGGSTSITASGASTYSWSNGLGTGTPKTVSPTTSFTYTVTGTDVNSCTNTANAIVTVNTLPTVTAGGGTICNGGSINITAGGANTYSWSNGLGTGTPKTVSPTTSFTYTVTGTDLNSCTNTANAVVTVNSLPTVTATSGAVCIGSSYTITASGASTYTWSGGGTGATKAVSPIAVSTYTVTGTDSHSCTNSATAIVTVNSLPTVTAGGGAICSGSSINITAGGASTYSWSNSLGTGTPKSVSPTTSTTYTVTGTDVSSCTNTANAVVIVNPLPTVTTAVGGAICSGGSTNITASGASTYSWSNGLGSSNPVTVSPAITTTYTVTGTDGNACTNTANAVVTVGGALPIITFTTNPSSGSICVGDIASITASGADIYVWSNGLGSSNPLTVNPTTNTTYTVTGTNTFGCSNTATTVITVNSFPSIIITYNPSSGIICKSQKLAAIYANPTDGISSYNYSWNTGGSSSSLTGLTPTSSTTYTVTVTNTDGSCPITANAVITVNTAVPSVTVSQLTSFVCNGNMTTLTANPTGGSGVYSYSWSAALGSTQTVNASPTTTTTYTVTVTDANTCTTKNTATFKVLTVATPTIAAAICNGVSATLSATESGGTSPYTYSWSSNPSGFNSTFETSASTVTTYAVSPTISSTYTVTTTDANSCSATSSVAVKVVAVTSTANTVICTGGSFTLSALQVNGTAPHTYSWSSNPIGFSSPLTTQSVTPTSATTYTVTYTSTSSGCTATSSTSVSINSIPVITVNPSTNVCKGSTVSLSSTTGDSYSWSNSLGTTETVTVSPVATATYTVSVTTSGKSCSATNKVTISAWTQTNSLIASPSPVCNGGTVALAVTPIAGSTYTWSSGCVGTASCYVAPAITTTYTVTITKTGTGTCIAGTIVSVNPLPTVTVGGGGLICNGNSSNLTAGGANTYLWNSNPSGFSSALANPTVSPTTNTTYTVTGTDGNGCSATANTAITVDSPTMTITGTCSGSSATLSASGMNTYSWSNSLGTGASVIVNPTVTTVYTVTGTDASLCTLTSSITVLMSPSCSILPVTLLYFRNECVNNVNELQWATATETNNNYFRIQNSKDGYYFEDIKEIKGAGNSNRIIEYRTNVSSEENEIYPVYYRLKQTDFNGTYSYSDIIAFNGCLNDFSFRIINNGNTFNRDLFIKIISNDTYPLNISLYDFTGRLVENKVNIIDKNIHIVIPNLSSGIYILKISNTFKNYMEKIIVR